MLFIWVVVILVVQGDIGCIFKKFIWSNITEYSTGVFQILHGRIFFVYDSSLKTCRFENSVFENANGTDKLERNILIKYE